MPLPCDIRGPAERLQKPSGTIVLTPDGSTRSCVSMMRGQAAFLMWPVCSGENPVALSRAANIYECTLARAESLARCADSSMLDALSRAQGAIWQTRAASLSKRSRSNRIWSSTGTSSVSGPTRVNAHRPTKRSSCPSTRGLLCPPIPRTTTAAREQTRASAPAQLDRRHDGGQAEPRGSTR